MSLIASDKGNGTHFEIIPEDTYTAICCEVIDLGLQRNETYDKVQPKVLIGWELPELQVEMNNGEKKPRIYTKQYTNSLNERATLRKDLVAWRGKQFTEEEKRGFDVSKLLGVPCLLQIVHTKSGDRTYANLGGITKLPKNMEKPVPQMPQIRFDIDESPLSMIDEMPTWIQDIIKESIEYKKRTGSFEELADNEGGELPF